jgi:hypothetical protein
VSLHPCVPAALATASWDSWTRVRHVTHPQQGVPIVDCHDHISGEGHRISLIWDFIEFHASGEGSQGHEFLHHAAVPELVLDGGKRCLGTPPRGASQSGTLAAAPSDCRCCGSRDVHHTRAARLLVVATIVVDRGCGLLKMMLAPFPTALGTFPSVLDGDVRWCLPAVAWGPAKLGRLAAGGILGGDVAQLLGGIPEDISQCMEGLFQRHVASAASGCLCP